ncbi:hypothetical protein E5163_00150 [Marinicauda algicola]|uniref:YhdP central domain-containing protein n=1 Tax=Marinicauda algicola TaxID=2029849 RepID=A0A4S2H1Y2_9PROT|nr:DUF3971 domain-containing protein [Marinicauda algicola]TGY89595.1 hypothetical protein E5163_00150 [Marinicauda algicola]
MMKRTARLALLYTLEAIAALLALALFAGAVVLWRLASGPVPLEMLRPNVTAMLAEAFEAERAEIGQLTLRYDPDLAAIVVTASDVRVYEETALLTAAREIEAGFALDLLLIGRAAPVMVAADGGSFSLVRHADGSLAAGLGRPGRLGAGGADTQRWERLLSDAQGGGAGDTLSRLVRVDLRGADIRVLDAVTDTALFFEGARARVDLANDRIDADLSGTLLSSAGQTPIALGLVADRGLEALFVDLRIRGLVPASVAPRRGAFAALSGIEAPVDLDLVIDASREAGLRSALLELDLGAGHWRSPRGVFPVEGGEASLAYDTQAARIDVSALRLQSELLQLDLSGAITDLAGYQDALPSRARYELVSGPGRLDLAGVFPEPLRWEAVTAQGDLDRESVRIGFDRLDIELDIAEAAFTGAVSFEIINDRLLPNLRLEGPIRGNIGKEDVLRFWPVDFALGARDWIRDSVLGGRLSDAQLFMDVPAEGLARKFIEDEALSLSFHFHDADVRYVSTMTPLRGLSGTGELLGNSLVLDGTGGRIGDLIADTIFVRAPQLNPKGAMARFGGTGRGQAADLIALLDEEPLGFATDYGIDPASFEGEGSIRFEIGRPMLRDVPVEDVEFDIGAEFTGVAGPAGVGDLRFTDGTVLIEADAARLVGTGVAELAGARADIRWEEDFNAGEGADSTLISVSARADPGTLDRLGLPVRRFLDGPADIDARLSGNGFEFRTIALSMDLADTAIALPGALWSKPSGVPAAAAFTVAFEEDGSILLSDLTAQAPDAALAASAELAADGRLLSASARRVFVEDLLDLAVEAGRPEGPEGPLLLRASGPFLTAGDLLDQLPQLSFEQAGPAEPAGLPLILEAEIDSVTLRSVDFEGVQLRLVTRPEGVERFLFAGRTQAGPVDLRFAPSAEGGRILAAEGADAGALLEAFAGFDNARGGVLRLSGEAPPLGEEGPLRGRVEVGAFTLEQMPLLARILAAGSLEGLASLVSGEGLVFERLEADYVWNDGVLQMGDARVAGPALGITWNGVVDLSGRRMTLDGTLLPSYGMNSVLGELPVVGELLTSRRGEGVIGVTFSVQGPFEATRVTANPLSALAPGVFRRIFEGTSAARELEALEAQRREAREAEASSAEDLIEDVPVEIPDAPAEPEEPGPPGEEGR